jgi:putative ABC transport system substrate-binding protein
LDTALRYAASLPNSGDLTELDHLKRRSFITLLGSAAVWPFAARAQQPTVPVIGFLHAGSPEDFDTTLAPFRLGLAEAGYVDGQSVTIEYLWG